MSGTAAPESPLGAPAAEPATQVAWGVLRFDTPALTVPGVVAKRAMDVVAATVLLVLSFPVWIVAAMAIRLEGPGPILFRQVRIGSRPIRDGWHVHWRPTPFRVVKFRTMVADADPALHKTTVERSARGEEASGSDAAAPYKISDDPRVTRVGRVLRSTSLDELPQLLNVLQGSMSLVGPRPLPDYEVALFEDWHYERLCAPPGITGLWQVEGRGRTSFNEGIRMDIDYVRSWSLRQDVALLLRTVPAVLSRRGAR